MTDTPAYNAIMRLTADVKIMTEWLTAGKITPAEFDKLLDACRRVATLDAQSSTPVTPSACTECDHPWERHHVDFDGSQGCSVGYGCQCNGYNVHINFGYTATG